jgi:hypothetical protein
MPLERLKSVPTFAHKIDEYELARMDPTDAYIARKNSELHQLIEWNNTQTLLINNAVVDQNDDLKGFIKQVESITKRLDAWDRKYEILMAKIKSPFVIAGAIITVFGPTIVSFILEHYFSKK